MTSPSCHIQNKGGGRQRDSLQSGGNIFDVLENVSPSIALTLTGKLFLGRALDIIQLHREMMRQFDLADKRRAKRV
jgi:hypothetical protein